MKDYEKAAIAIGAAALGLAAYQAHKTKQAADASEATDPAKNPISAAIDLAQHTIGSVGSWFRQRLDPSTGYVKGKAEDVIDILKANPVTPLYWIDKGKDFGLTASEAGTKYIWGIGAKIAKTGKDVKERICNKPFTLMGAIPESVYVASRKVPTIFTTLQNSLTGIGSNKEKTTKKIGGVSTIKNWMESIHPTKKLIGGDTGYSSHLIYDTLKYKRG